MLRILLFSFCIFLFCAPNVFSQSTRDVTFQVDISNIPSFRDLENDVYVLGSDSTAFGFWTNWQKLERDAQNLELYSITLEMGVDSQSYKFFTGQNAGTDGELLDAQDGNCANPIEVNGTIFYDRFFELFDSSTDTVLNIVSIGTCELLDTTGYIKQDVINGTKITFQVDVGNRLVSNGVQIYGSVSGWSKTDEMSNSNGDNIWEKTYILQPGEQHQYRFSIDNVVEAFDSLTRSCTSYDWAVANGQDAYRQLMFTSLPNLTLPPVCFSSCSGCADEIRYDVLFELDMKEQNYAGQKIFISGDFTNNDFQEMTPTVISSDSIFQFYVENLLRGSHEVKFSIGGRSENIPSGCPTVDNLGSRIFELSGDNSGVQNLLFCYEKCQCATVGTDEELFENSNLFEVNPTLFSNKIEVSLNSKNIENGEFRIMNLAGNTVFQKTISSRETKEEISTSAWESGIYILSLKTKRDFQVQKIIKIN